MSVDELVEQLEYAGGQDEGLGGYCEALIIRVDGEEKYVLHRMGQEITGEDKEGKSIIIANHEKIEYKNKKEMLKNFPYGSDSIFKGAKWEKTDRTCGYKIPIKEFNDAHERRYEKEL